MTRWIVELISRWGTLVRLCLRIADAHRERSHAAFLEEEFRRLSALGPDIGGQELQAATQMLVADGYSAEDLKWMAARDVVLAVHAYRWRKGANKGRS